MQNTELDEAQARIKIARKNINNLRYADDTSFMAESKKNLLLTICKAKNIPYGSRENVQMQSLVTELISFS